MKSFMSLLPLAALGFCAPQPLAPVPITTITSYGPTQTIVYTSATTVSSVSWDTKETHISYPVPTSAPEVIELFVHLQVDINVRLVELNATIAAGVEVGSVVEIVEDVLKVVIVLIEDVVAILGKVVVSVIVFTEVEVTQLVRIIVAIIADILWTVSAIIHDLKLGNLLAEVLILVAHVLVLLLTVVSTLVANILELVGALLVELGLAKLVQGLLFLVFTLLRIIL